MTPKPKKLKQRDLLIQKVRSGEIKCPLHDKGQDCIGCKYLRECASKLDFET